MFTGLIAAIGSVETARDHDGGRRLTIASPFGKVVPGESIAVDGACLTVVEATAGAFTVQVVATSLGRTGFGAYQAGRRVNLERALQAGDRLGGHLVQGHVDGVGVVEQVRTEGDARLVDLRVPGAVFRASVPLGSIAVDGVSLTVNALPAEEIVQVSLIPFTLQHTTLGDRAPGDRVHLEGDAIGKYVAEWMSRRGGQT
ncbi:MAG TPA: riboflavin synthase [Gemmatimonadales bacterium]|nr:riboflavin synthase [Gemmatimonadales bacterium]